MLTVACVKWGTAYGAEYVHNLQAMVRRHLIVPYKFKCFTDNPAGLHHSIVEPLYSGLEGWWGKLSLFQPAQFNDRVLFFDLDTVILGSLDDIAEYSGNFAILRDFFFPQHYGSGVMAWTPSAITADIWESWNAAGRPRAKNGDQEWVERALKQSGIVVDCWQDLFPGEFVSYKNDCFYMPPRPEAKVVCFHGKPKPHECNRKFVTDNWTTDYRAAELVGTGAGASSPTLIGA